MSEEKFTTDREGESSPSKADPMNRPVTGKEVGATIFALVWIGVSAFVASRNLIVGGLMLAGMIVVGFVAFQRDIRSRSPEEQAKFAKSIKRYENSKLMLAVKLLKFLLLIYILYLAYLILFKSSAM